MIILSHRLMNDYDLVRQVLNGNAKAFEMLVDQHQRLVSHMVGRVIQVEEDLEEVCQDVFMIIYNRLEDFNFNSKLSTWIATIAYRTSLNFIKKKGYDVKDIDDYHQLSALLTVEDLHIEKDSKHYIHKLINHLPVHYRTIITLYHIEEMKYNEIAEITQLPEGTIKSHLFRARKLLKEKLEVFLEKELL